MKKNRIIKVLSLLPLLMAMLLLCAACAAVRPTQQADRDFYKEQSRKMGVKFKGNEEKEIIKASSHWLGTPYRYGGQAKNGVDCSGFVSSAYKEAYGVTLQRNSAAMAKQVQRVDKNDLLCGDLVFFTIKDKRVSHVGIYMGDNKFVHASTNYGVSMADLTDAYWSKYFSGAGRMPGLAQKTQKVAEPDNRALTDSNVAAAVVSAAKKDTTPAVKKDKAAVQKQSKKSNADDVIVVFDEEF